ncbi:hypothetical protein Droror1_Dr00022536 [Drosera rotundifolia]
MTSPSLSDKFFIVSMYLTSRADSPFSNLNPHSLLSPPPPASAAAAGLRLLSPPPPPPNSSPAHLASAHLASDLFQTPAASSRLRPSPPPPSPPNITSSSRLRLHRLHKSRECLPLILIVRNKMKYALTYREVIAILMQRQWKKLMYSQQWRRWLLVWSEITKISWIQKLQSRYGNKDLR